MSDDIIRYDLLVQDALRSVVRKVLADAAHNGLPGEHHFYITFRTDARGLRLSNRMRERYPEEMTIILQHQFWDLSVTDQAFEVGLSFSGISEKLLIPFEAIVSFSDPSVEFGLKFAVQEPEPEVGANDVAPAKRAGPKSTTKLPPRIADKSPRGAASEPAETKPGSQPKLAPVAKTRVEKPASKDDVKDQKSGDPKVVSIDAFRKKP
jgi:hypothetical protein